jgi:lysozyme family protein
MSALVSWLTTTFGPLGGALAGIVLLIIGAYIAWYAFWGIVTLAVAVVLRRDSWRHTAGDLLARLFGTTTTDEQRYTCQCGAPMKNTIARSQTEYRVETWECTDEDCLRAGQAYRFEDEAHNYGTGPLAGQVNP